MAKWKSGVWHIARVAGLPIVPIHFHYPERTIGFGPPLMPGEDMDADIAALRAYYAPFRGKHRGVD